jgi:tripartite-type tricarboxylate transporter receptor subunit TctC
MPSKTPRAIIDKFHDAAAKVMATPAMQAKMKQLALDPRPMTPTEIDQLVVKELSSNEKLIKAAGIK